MENRESIQIPFAGPASPCLTLYEEAKKTLFVLDEAEEQKYGDPRWQLIEGCNYEYELPDKDYRLINESVVVQPSRSRPHCGRICTNVYVGSLSLIIKKGEEIVDTVRVEVQSAKVDYREDYQMMLEEITHKCTELLMQQSAPVEQYFQLNPVGDSQTLYQQFAFIHSLIDSEEIADAIHRIHTSPVTKWKEAEVSREISNLRRINQRMARQLQTGTQRVSLPEQHPARKQFDSLPQKVTVPYKEETVDIPENRFVKYVLETFLQFCYSLASHKKAGKRLKREAGQTIAQLEQYLSLSLFKEISHLTVLPLNSPVLQRKEGYREILSTWLKFDMAAKLVWHGGDDIYRAGKKDIAVLYEYWLFFKLVEIIEEVFQISPISIDHLIVPTDGHLQLILEQGEPVVIEGICRDEKGNRDLHVEFHYNKTFESTNDYTQAGSWTVQMRPDYTLTIRPLKLKKKEAEKQELLVHIHFDAKYKIDLYKQIFGERIEKEEKNEERKGHYKNADLLKMHAYKDAIHRTEGAYILYPGDIEDNYKPYHEILPGLGAFTVAPNKENNGTGTLKKFLQDVIDHIRDRATQREKIAYHQYNILSQTGEVKESKVKNYTPQKPLDPTNTNVLVAYYRDKQHREWITATHLYNIRTGKGRGALPLNEKTAGVKYLLLHGPGETQNATLLYRVSKEGPEVYSREELLDKGYPSDPTTSFYIVYELLEGLEEELKGKAWDIRVPGYYKSGRRSGDPFVVPLEELLENKPEL